jgi:hypothetical protein
LRHKISGELIGDCPWKNGGLAPGAVISEELPWVIDQLLEACGGSGGIANIKSLADFEG